MACRCDRLRCTCLHQGYVVEPSMRTPKTASSCKAYVQAVPLLPCAQAGNMHEAMLSPA
jgi:hypothetical protein